jgi:hypothetical protein
MRIDFVYVPAGDKKVPVNPEHLVYIAFGDHSNNLGKAVLILTNGEKLETNISVEDATKLFSPMPIAGGH